MSVMVSQITRISIVYPTICSGADQKKSKLHVTGLCEGIQFPAQRSSNTKICEALSSWSQNVELFLNFLRCF